MPKRSKDGSAGYVLYRDRMLKGEELINILELDNFQIAHVFIAFLKYYLHEEVTEFEDKCERAVYSEFCEAVDAGKEKWDEYIRQKVEAGIAGARKKAENVKLKNSGAMENVSGAIQNDSGATEKDSGAIQNRSDATENVAIKEKKKEEKTREENIRPLKSPTSSADILRMKDCGSVGDICADVLDYLNERTGSHYRSSAEYESKISTLVNAGYGAKELKGCIARKYHEYGGTDEEGEMMDPKCVFDDEVGSVDLGQLRMTGT